MAEFIRTERTDGAEARLAKLAQSLIGHQVTVGVAVEGTGDVKVRVARSITSNGVDAGYNPADPAYQPSYEKLDLKKLASQQAA